MFAARNYSGVGSTLDWRLIGPAYWSAFENSMNSTIATATVSDTVTTPTAPASPNALIGGVCYLDTITNIFKIFLIPNFSGSAVNGFIYTPSTNSFTQENGNGSGYNIRFSGGVLLKSNKVFLIPYSSGNALIVTPGFNFNTVLNSPDNLRGGVLMADGRVYCYPDGFSSTTASIFNSANNTYSNAGGTTISANNAILLKDGRIFLSGTSSCRIYDPTLNAITTPNVGGGGYSLLLQNGNVFIFNGSTIRIYYPNLDAEIISATTPIAGLSRCVLLPNGKVFLIPVASSSAQIYDPITDSLTTSSVVFPTFSGGYSIGGYSMPDGRVLLMPGDFSGYSNRVRVYGGNTGFNQNVLLSSYYNASPK